MSQSLALAVWLVLPMALVVIALLFHLRGATPQPVIVLGPDSPRSVRFEVLVPIYGDLRFLENVNFLARYRDRVVLCTTGAESDEFYDALTAVCLRHGFRVSRTDVSSPSSPRSGRRAVDGPVRDQLIRDALHRVRSPYVVCLDADTAIPEPIEKLVGVVRASGVDVASVGLVPATVVGRLARLQVHEHRMATWLRRLCPWLVSGACHVARTEALREVMDRHSLFSPGSDAEVGILVEALGYDAGHVLLDAPTILPSTVRSWSRRRVAAAGGVFRLFAVNVRLGRRHPWLWLYGLLVVLVLAPLRWLALVADPVTVAAAVALYVVTIIGLNWRTRDRALPLLPVSMLVSTLVLVPLSALSYARTAIRYRNGGVIDPTRWVEAEKSVAWARGSSVARPALATDPMRVSSCMAVAALGAHYSVPHHLSRDRLFVSLKRGEVRIGREANGRMVVVARHPRMDAGSWSVLEAHLPPPRTDAAAPTQDEVLDLWAEEARPQLPTRRHSPSGVLMDDSQGAAVRRSVRP